MLNSSYNELRLNTRSLKTLLLFNSVFAWIVCVVFAVVSFVLNWEHSFQFFVLYVGCYGLSSWVIYLNYTRVGAILLYLFELTGIVLISCLFGKEQMLQIMLLLLVIFPFVYFVKEGVLFKAVAGLGSFASLVFLEWSDYSLWPRETHFQSLKLNIEYVLLATAFFIQWMVMYFFGKGISERISLKKSLEMEVQYSAQQVKLNEELQKANSMKEYFLRALSHELKTPLHTLQLTTDLLKSETDEAQRKHYTARLEIENLKLNWMLSNTLDLARLKSSDIQLFPVCTNLRILCLEVMSQLQVLCDEYGKTIELNCDPRVSLSVDSMRLRQILLALLDNALRFGEGSLVILNVSHGDGFEFSVLNQGHGIPIERQKLALELFDVVERDYSRTQNGMGIGLALSSALLKLMNSELNFSLEGVWFGVSFVLRHETCGVCARPSPNYQIRGDRILIVEDQKINAKMLGALLAKMGWQTEWADNGQSALDKLKDFSPQFVLMDLQMPIMDGFECTRQIRRMQSEKQLPAFPIFALSANSTEKDRGLAFEAGVDGFLAKPISKDELKKYFDPLYEKK